MTSDGSTATSSGSVRQDVSGSSRDGARGHARFPDEVVVAMHGSGVTLGCLPVRIDDDDWRAALFYVVPPDAPCLIGRRSGIGPATPGGSPAAAPPSTTLPSTASPLAAPTFAAPPSVALPGAPFAVALEADLHEHTAATVIELGIEIRTPGGSLAGSVLFLSGHSSAHFDVLTLLGTQPDLPLFIGDEYCRLLASQRVPLGDAERSVFRTLLDEAVGRDAVIRLSGRYDAEAAFDDVLRLIAGGAAGDVSGASTGSVAG